MAECRLIGGLALEPLAERLMDVPDGHPQLHFFGFELRRPLVCLERLRLAQEPCRHAGNRDPGLRVFGLDLDKTACSGVRLREATERQQYLRKSPPDERVVLGLF